MPLLTRVSEKVVKVEVPAEWADAVDENNGARKKYLNLLRMIVEPINAQKGDSLPVSAFKGREDGTFPQGTAAYEKTRCCS